MATSSRRRASVVENGLHGGTSAARKGSKEIEIDNHSKMRRRHSIDVPTAAANPNVEVRKSLLELTEPVVSNRSDSRRVIFSIARAVITLYREKKPPKSPYERFCMVSRTILKGVKVAMGTMSRVSAITSFALAFMKVRKLQKHGALADDAAEELQERGDAAEEFQKQVMEEQVPEQVEEHEQHAEIDGVPEHEIEKEHVAQENQKIQIEVHCFQTERAEEEEQDSDSSSSMKSLPEEVPTSPTKKAWESPASHSDSEEPVVAHSLVHSMRHGSRPHLPSLSPGSSPVLRHSPAPDLPGIVASPDPMPRTIGPLWTPLRTPSIQSQLEDLVPKPPQSSRTPSKQALPEDLVPKPPGSARQPSKQSLLDDPHQRRYLHEALLRSKESLLKAPSLNHSRLEAPRKQSKEISRRSSKEAQPPQPPHWPSPPAPSAAQKAPKDLMDIQGLRSAVIHGAWQENASSGISAEQTAFRLKLIKRAKLAEAEIAQAVQPNQGNEPDAIHVPGHSQSSRPQRREAADTVPSLPPLSARPQAERFSGKYGPAKATTIE